MKFLVPFAYTADVMPRRTRKPRREVLFGLAEQEIAEIPAEDLVMDAVVVRAPQETRSLAGYDGSLWSKLAVRPNYVGPQKSDLDSFVRSFARPHPAGPRNDNPLSRAYDEIEGPRELPRHDDGDPMERLREDRFDGQVVDASRRSAAIERCRAAARDLLIVGGDVYVRRRDPVWEIDYAVAPTLSLRSEESPTGEAAHFRVDRLEDARDWIRTRYRGDYPTHGEIVRIEPAFLRRDDLSHFLDRALRPFVEKAKSFLRHLDTEAVLALHRLSQAYDPDMRLRAPLRIPTAAAVADVRRLAAAVTAARVNNDDVLIHEDFVRDTVTPMLARVDFESARRVAELTALDEAALASLAEAGR